ncbi:DNA-directed RNA polymerase subunit delta [Paenibacillus harenae]|uniref:Probable DNA-directed RNA polymerase subunit delta n=1 Tax=Paenibacillus harenae TaxID=306543 RepID=A0ABT9U9P1_PAEHA|nr:DNA-directed RNA polymerase subunit delta [Paenibacillus harenae]MDQ0063857.1 DNA-directed RNA polymerase subunit delta [Paenibacillus harenae]MDQ0116362.1 DNA-directed RNA polymerase subunit delta [Paenibacillus harenae]
MSSSNFTLKLDPERMKEMPMVDLAFEVLKAANTPYYYRDLMMEIAKIRGLSAEGINQFIAQVYTEINIDGRFACVGSNMWGLKRWYPVERSEDPVGNAKRTRIINDDDDDDDDLFADEEEDTYAAEEEDYDVFDEDREDFEEAEAEEEIDEEVVIDDEEIDEEEVEGELDADAEAESDDEEEDLEEEDEENDK